MKNMTIKARIMILGAIAVVGILIAGGFGIFQLSRFNAELEVDSLKIRGNVHTLFDIQAANVDFKTQVQEWKNILIRGNTEADFAKHEKAFAEKEKSVQERLEKVLEALKGDADATENASNLEQLIKDHASLGIAYRTALGNFDKNDPEAGKKIDVAIKGKDRAATDGMNKLAALLETRLSDFMEHQVADARATYEGSRNQLLIQMLVCFVLASGVMYFTVQHIAGQIARVQETTAKVKDTLDLTHRIAVSGTDEMAQVAGSVNALLDEFQAVVKRMKEAGVNVSGASDGLSHTLMQLATAVDQQNEATSSMAASVEELAVSVNHVSDSSAAAKEIAQDSLNKAKEGGLVIENTVREMMAMAGTVRSTSSAMELLGKRTDEIGGIAGVIKEIADQTNLLALNAAIEAARAGDAGRGFAVVADEVRKLAEKTMIATQEVGQAITGIQEGTRKNIHNVEQAGVSIEEAAKLSVQSGESLKQILEFVHMVNDQVQSIATASEQQSAASEEINHSVEQVATISAETAQAMEQASSAVADLAQQSQALQRLIVEMKKG